ncbi:MAG: hypothetical protein GY699_12215 [Desulfobacteraceae bacterium]|nr:hypothetical protein [Desulfobacteraceae bacterium]
MESENKIKRAQEILNSFNVEERKKLRSISLEIQNAQDDLNSVAGKYFDVCIGSCKGKCCKNIHTRDIIILLDYIFILSLDNSVYAQLIECAKKESLFSADCFFLLEGVGPCVFGSNLKPERCIITFCYDTPGIKKEIKAVRSKFSKLSRFILFHRPFMWFDL